jgi:polysaccharide pyruvyl transferase WcaK-like protein
MNPSDGRWTRTALAGVDAEIVAPVDAAAAARELARCSVAITSRLHAGILASLSETPVVSLEYQPKCRDFALSIDDERSLIRTDQLTSGDVVDRVLATFADSASIRVGTAAAVARLRERLSVEYAAVGTHLGLDDQGAGVRTP